MLRTMPTLAAAYATYSASVEIVMTYVPLHLEARGPATAPRLAHPVV